MRIYAPIANEHLWMYEPCGIQREIMDRLSPFLSSLPNVLNFASIILEYIGVWGLHYFFLKNSKLDNEYVYHFNLHISLFLIVF